jgi:hypothetical protein
VSAQFWAMSPDDVLAEDRRYAARDRARRAIDEDRDAEIDAARADDGDDEVCS